MSAINTESFVVEGIDLYSGNRKVTARVESAHVELTCECTQGAGEGESLLTPDQARYLGRGLIILADSLTEFYQGLANPAQ